MRFLPTPLVRGTTGTECFLVEVAKRDAPTLGQKIVEFIEPGSTIASDMWAAYNRIDQLHIDYNLPVAYRHIQVNHSTNFVNSLNPDAHTQSIESLWQKFKSRHKRHYGTAETLFHTYIDDFIWRRQLQGLDIM